MKEQVSLERLAELQKHAAVQSQNPDLLAASLADRHNHIKSLARMSLGIPPQMEIGDIQQPERTELLIIMSGIRDNLYPKQGEDL